MNIYFMSTATSLVGGAIRSLLSIIEDCKSQDIKCTVVLKGHGPIEQELDSRQINYVVVKSYDWMQPHYKWKGLANHIKWFIKKTLNFVAEVKIYHIFAKEKPDLYYLNVLYNPCGVKAAKKLKIPIIWHIREFVNIDDVNTDWFYDSKKAFRVMKYANKYVAITDSIKNYYSQFLPGDKIIRIYNGLEMPSNIKERQPQKQLYKITLSGAKKFKGHIDAIESFRILKGRGIKNIKLRLIGAFIDTDYLEFLQNKIKEYMIEDMVEFNAFTKDMEAVFTDTDIGLICSRYEPFSRYAVEIMSRAIPLITTESAGVYEVTHYGEYCSTYPETDYNQLANVIQTIVENYSDYASKAYRISEIVRDEYSVQRTTHSVIELIRETAVSE